MPTLTAHVDLVKEVVGLGHIIKGHTKHRLLGGVKCAILLCLASDEQAGQVHCTTTNQKLQKDHPHQLDVSVCVQGTHLEEEMREEAPEKPTGHAKVGGGHWTVDDGQSYLQVTPS